MRWVAWVVMLAVLDCVVFNLCPRLDACEELVHQRRHVVCCLFDLVGGLHILAFMEGIDGGVDVDVVLAELLLNLR